MSLIAALPMYDWPETRAETDALWARLRDRLRGDGIDAPERLVRRNADLPPVPGGIRDAAGAVIAPDPATLPQDKFDLHVLWRHPDLLVAQTCWGPMEQGLAPHVEVVAQPDYSAFDGGDGELYSSAIVMRGGGGNAVGPPVDRLRNARFAFNGPDSMSGLLALEKDLENAGESLDLFAERIETGSHRASIAAVAEGRADVCAVDCRTWDLALRFEPRARDLAVVGWTAKRPGLPYVTARRFAAIAPILRAALA